MRPFWGIDLTRNKKNDRRDGDLFIVASASSEKAGQFADTVIRADAAKEKTKLPLPLRIVQYVFGMTALICMLSIFRAEVSFAEAYSNAPGVFWAAGICLVLFCVLALLSKWKSSNALVREENAAVSAKMDTLASGLFAELGVPANAKTVDVLSFRYVLKNGKPIVKADGFAEYQNLACKVYTVDDMLYLADPLHKYAFLLSEIQGIRTVKKQVSFMEWNKPYHFTEEPYKAYRIRTNEFGAVFSTPYYILEIRHSGELWGIYFPCYELPVFEALTGKAAAE